MTDEDKIVVRVLKIVREAIVEGHHKGYWSPGGPQDGESEPPHFEDKWAADYLAREITNLEAS